MCTFINLPDAVIQSDLNEEDCKQFAIVPTIFIGLVKTRLANKLEQRRNTEKKKIRFFKYNKSYISKCINRMDYKNTTYINIQMCVYIYARICTIFNKELRQIIMDLI